MLGISASHLIILALVLVIFGPRRIPELARKMGRAVKGFRDGIQGVAEADFRTLDPEETKPDSIHRAPSGDPDDSAPKK